MKFKKGFQYMSKTTKTITGLGLAGLGVAAAVAALGANDQQPNTNAQEPKASEPKASSTVKDNGSSRAKTADHAAKDAVKDLKKFAQTQEAVKDAEKAVKEAEKAEQTAATYQVKENDSLWTISQATGISVDELAAHNGIANPNVIHVGDTIQIPTQAPSVQAAQTASAKARERLQNAQRAQEEVKAEEAKPADVASSAPAKPAKGSIGNAVVAETPAKPVETPAEQPKEPSAPTAPVESEKPVEKPSESSTPAETPTPVPAETPKPSVEDSNHKPVVPETPSAPVETTETVSTKTVERYTPFETETVYDNTLPYGSQNEVQPGIGGKTVVKITERFVNGVSQGQTEEVVSVTPVQNRVIVVGTYQAPAPTPTTPVESTTTPTGPIAPAAPIEEPATPAPTEGDSSTVVEQPVQPTQPVTPVQPTEPVAPTTPVEPTLPVVPVTPDQPQPEKPVDTPVEETVTTRVHDENRDAVAYQVETTEDAELEAGKTVVDQEGVDGYTVYTVTETLKNGQVVGSQTAVKEVVAPVNKKVRVGTKKAYVPQTIKKSETVRVDENGTVLGSIEGYDFVGKSDVSKSETAENGDTIITTTTTEVYKKHVEKPVTPAPTPSESTLMAASTDELNTIKEQVKGGSNISDEQAAAVTDLDFSYNVSQQFRELMKNDEDMPQWLADSNKTAYDVEVNKDTVRNVASRSVEAIAKMAHIRPNGDNGHESNLAQGSISNADIKAEMAKSGKSEKEALATLIAQYLYESWVVEERPADDYDGETGHYMNAFNGAINTSVFLVKTPNGYLFSAASA